MNSKTAGRFLALVLFLAATQSWSQELRFTTQDFPPFSYNIEGAVSGPAVDA